MNRKELLLFQSAWMKDESDSPIILSNRIRLARDLENVPFPHMLSPEKAVEVERLLAGALESIEIDGQRLTYLPLTELSDVELQVLIEKHLISPALVSERRGRGVALTPDHRIAVMVNEEDHLRLQVLMAGKNLAESYRLAQILDDELEKRLNFAYRETQGYLTACPTNVGTGLRASVMVHLPGLVMVNRAQQILGSLAHMGLVVRGTYGEGSQAHANLFQISNQITLGKSEEEIIAHLESVTAQIVEHERQAREVLRVQGGLALEDKVWRARGTLANARLLTSEDVMQLLSHDQLGVDLGILPKRRGNYINLLVNSLPGCLQYNANKTLDPHERDAERARLIRQAFM